MNQQTPIQLALTALKVLALSSTLILAACQTRSAAPEATTPEKAKPEAAAAVEYEKETPLPPEVLAALEIQSEDFAKLYEAGDEVALATLAEKTFAAVDEVASLHGDDEDYHPFLGALFARKGFIEHEYLGDYQGAAKSFDKAIEFTGDDDDLSNRANGAEAALNAGNNKEAIERAAAVLKRLDASNADVPVMKLITWLANGKADVKGIRKAIAAVPQETEFSWVFNGSRKAALPRLSKVKRTQATCFFDFFEAEERDDAKLDVCLKKAK